ncbi:MAG TPA: ABC transporter substrate-binding protein [Eubacteriaceae bacterium]|jgi:branched-chain amino acid transport system substrate-binding protein|nr:ABC transporter substrate-binding protein [Eubacteriaceae bacterium]
MKKILGILLVVLLVSSLIMGCSSQGTSSEDEDVIKIGVFEPLTGANAAGGAMEVEGIELANEMFPEVLGKKVVLEIADNKSEKVEAANAATYLVDNANVVAIIGSWGSSLSMAAGPVAEENQIPIVAPSATNPMVTQGNDWYFRVCFIDPFQGKVMANYAYNEVGAKTAAIVREISNDYSVGLASFFVNSFKELTGDDNAILEIVDYNTGDTDFTAQLTSIKEKNPDVIFAPGNYTESALLAKQARELGINVPILGGDTWETPEFIDIGKEAVEGAVLSTFFTTEVPITPMSGTFLEAYQEKYNKEPAAVTALGFDAYLVILKAIERAGSTDPVVIRDEIAKTSGFEGAAGIVTLDENGDATKNAIIKEVKDGKFVYLTTVEP